MGEFYALSINESGNNFEFSLYGGYYLDIITFELAEFFLDIFNYDKKTIY